MTQSFHITELVPITIYVQFLPIGKKMMFDVYLCLFY